MIDDIAAAWLTRDLVRVGGPDARSFLQGQLSQDVSSNSTALTLVLQPQGKLDAWARFSAAEDDDCFLLDIEGGWGGHLVERLERFLIRVKVVLELEEGVSMLAIRGQRQISVPPVDATLVSPFTWHGWQGLDLIGVDEPPSGVRVVGRDVYEQARIAKGFPVMGAELDARTIPAEVPGLVETSVSFSKGCYTGQELVARIDSRGGNVARHLRRLELDGVAPVAAEVVVDGKVVGVITSSADGAALAFIGRSVVPPAPAIVSWGAGEVGGVVLAVGG